MKIIHISPSYFPAIKYGGPVQSVHLLNKYLVRNGCQVDVLTTNAGLSRGQKSEVRERWNYVDGVRVKYVNFIGYGHFNFSLSFIGELRKIIASYDLVHITAVWNFPVLIGCLLSIIKKKPFVISPRGALYKESLEFKRSFLKRIYFSLLIKSLIKKSYAIHFTSELDRERFFDFVKFEHNHFIVPNGIEFEKILQLKNSTENSPEFNTYTDKKYILFLGRVNAIKGLDVLIPAFAKLTFEHDVNLLIAGPDNEGYRNEVERLIKIERIEKKVVFTGLVTEIKWSLIENALLLILPSYSENFGMSVVEAMACNIAVVISDKVGIYKEVKEAKAGIIVNTDIDDLYLGMKELVTNDKLRETIAHNGRKLAEEKYDIEKVADQMIMEYKKIVKEYNV